jgi:PAS domain S-box-containing protein
VSQGGATGSPVPTRPRGPRGLVGWWTDRSLLTKALVAVGMPATALLIATVVFFAVDAETHTAGAWVTRTINVTDRLSGIRGLLVDGETGVRGYVLTGERTFLEPYDNAVGRISGVLDQAGQLVADNPVQVVRLTALRQLVDQRLALFQEVIAEGPVASSGISSGQRALLDRGKAVMDEVRAAIAEMQATEDQLLAERQTQAEVASNSGQLLVVGTLVAGLAGSLLAVILLTAGVVRRVKRLEANAELLAAGQPIVPLTASKDEVGQLATNLERASVLLVEREQALRRALDEATDLYENAPTGYHAADADNVIVRMNATELRWLGYDRAEVIGKLHGVDLYTPESAERFRQLRAIFLEQGAAPDSELEMLRKDGSSFPVLITASAVRDEAGRVIGSRVSVVDISARKAAERELESSRADLDRFFDLSDDLFVVAGPEGRFLRINAAWTRVLGYEPRVLLSRPFREFVHADDRVRTDLEFSVQIGEGHRTIRFENRYLHADGSIRWLEWSSQFNPASGVVHAIARDVTDRMAAAAELEEARAEADRANRAKSEFLSRMSHELRTPLNAILGFAQLLGMDHLDDDQRESADQILKGGRHLLDLINEVLDISRIETDQLPMSPEPVDLREAVEDAVALIGPLATPRGIAVHVEAIALGQHVLADRQRLKQVLLNLLSNAVKYNRDAGAVRIACRPAGTERLRLSVTDEGPGVSPALRHRLFAPFDRLGVEASATEGTGLGLALSKALVEHMDGTIGVDSTPGEGSTFWLELPVATPAASEPSGEPPLPVATAVGTTAAGTVLYIEDNLSNFRLVERALALRWNVRLLPAMLGRLGLDLAREHRPDLVLLDLHLPDMSGEELLARLRADPATRDIPVIVLSADATPGQIERLLANGARAYLTKPLDISEFLALVDDVLVPGGES